MMGKGLGVETIRMYERLINEEFQPLGHILTMRNHELRKAIELQVKKDLGIYDLYKRRAQIEAELAEIEDTLEQWTKKKQKKTNYGFDTTNLIDHEVEKRMKELDGALDEMQSVKHELTKRIKLCGANDEIKLVFEEVTTTIKDFTEKVAKLPAPKKLVKAIPLKTKTGDRKKK